MEHAKPGRVGKGKPPAILSVPLVCILAATYVSAASAQNESASSINAATGEEPLEEVIVTGTRIAGSTNLTSASPVQVVSREEIRLQGTTDVIDLMNNLPQNFQNNNVDFSATTNPLSSPGGISTADLRGLGPQRTLVLVDGRRLGIGDANTGNPNPAPDLNQIPTLLVERVEVVTGGASAVYGSDAVGGVVNFIMRRDFQGIEFDGQYGFSQHHNDSDLMRRLLSQQGFAQPDSHVTDGRNKEMTLVMGANLDDNKGNVTAYFSYRDAAPVSQGARDFSACKVNVASNIPVCSGSPNSNEFLATDDSFDYTVVGNQFLDWPQTGSNPPALFNSNPYQYLSRQDTRYMAGIFAHVDINDYLKPYGEFTFMNDRARTEVAPSGLFEGQNPYNATGGILINCDNPLLSAQQRTAIGCAPGSTDDVDIYIGRRNLEGGGRVSEYEHMNYRGVVGVKGDLGSAWDYDVYGQYYYTSLYQLNDHYLSSLRVNRALQVVNVGGVPTCKSVVDGTDTSCVPYNIFTTGGVTPAQVNYLDSFGTEYGTVQQKTVAAVVRGDLGEYHVTLPTAKDGVSVALGTEYRSEVLSFVPDSATGSGDLSGFAGAATAIHGTYDVREIYGETRVPFVQEKTGLYDLAFEGGYRHSKYSNAGGVNTYKLALTYAPTPDARLRWSYQRAIRAPNIIELYNPQSVTNTSDISQDPCAGATPTASLAECQRTGVTPAQYGSIAQCPSGQCSILEGGNPDLKPEISDSVSLGLVLTPSFLPNFNASIDYYKIKVKDEIGNVPIDIVLANCMATGNPTYCNLVKRTSVGGLFGSTIAGGGYVEGASINVAEATVSGIDVQSAYRWSLGGHGSMSLGLTGSYLDSVTSTPLPGEHTYDCAGLYGATCGTVNPRWRHMLRVSWKMPINLTLSTQWRYIGKVSLDSNSSDETLSDGAHDEFNATLPSMSYVDMSAIWDVLPWLTLRAGINNVLDKDPPLVSSLIAGTGSPNTYPTYDLLGRVVFMGLTAKY
ncbi:MAG: TonB-dependent receptor [Steroidobacteraceae bacterium]